MSDGRVVIDSILDPSGIDKGISEIQSKLSGITSNISSLGSDFTEVGKAATVAFAPLTAFFGAALGGGISRMVGMEQAQNQIRQMVGDGADFEKVMDNVRKIADGTSYTYGEVAGYMGQTLGMQGSKEQANLFADVAMELGAFSGDKEVAKQINTMFAQSLGRGTIDGSMINRLNELGVSVGGILGNAMGIGADEASEMLRKGEIKISDALNILSEGVLNGSTGVNGEFAAFRGSMENYARTLPGIISNMWAAIGRVGERAIGTDGFEALKDAIDSIRGNLDNLAPMFDWIAGVAFRTFSALVDIIQRVIDAFLRLPMSVQSTVGTILVLASVIGPLMITLGLLLSSVTLLAPGFRILGAGLKLLLVPFTPLIKLVKFLQLGLTSLANPMARALWLHRALAPAIAILTNPIGWVVAAVAVLGASFVYLWKTNDQFKTNVITLWNAIKAAFFFVLPAIQNIVDTTWNAIKTSTMIVFNMLKTIVMEAINIILNIINLVLAILVGDWSTAWSSLQEILGSVWSIVKTIIVGSLDFILSLFKGWGQVMLSIWSAPWLLLGDYIKAGFAVAVSAVGGFISDLGSSAAGIFPALTKPINAVIDYFKSAFDGIGNIMLTLMPMIARLGLGFLGVTGPIGWIIAVVISLGIAIGRFIAGNEEAQATLLGIWDGIKSVFVSVVDAFQPVIDLFKEEFNKVLNDLAPAFKETGQVIMDALEELIVFFNDLGAHFGDTATLIAGFFTESAGMVSDFINNYLKVAKVIIPMLLDVVKMVFPLVAGLISTAIAVVIDIMSELIPVIVDIVMEIIPAFLNVVTTVFPAILSIIKSVIPLVMDIISLIIPVIMGIVKEVIPLLLDIFQTVFPALLGVIMSVIPIVLSVLQTIIPVVMAIVTAVIPLILDIVKAVFPFVLTIIQTVIPIVLTILEALISLIISILIPTIQFILDIVMAVFPALVAIIQNSLNIVMGFVNFWIAVFKGDWSAAWTAVKDVLAAIWDQILTVIKLAIDLAIATVTGAWKLMKSVTSAYWDAIKAYLSVLWDGIKAIVSATIEAIVSIIKARWESVKSTTLSVWENIKDGISRTWNAIKVAIANAILSAYRTIKSVWNSIKTFCDNVVNNIKEGVAKKFIEMVDAIRSIMDTAKQAVIDGWEAAQDFLASIDLWQIGKDIIGGLTRGITSALGSVKTAVSGLADNIPGWLKSVLGIKSPSRVIRDQVGRWIPSGLAVGIEGNMDEVEDATKQLTLAATPEMPKIDFSWLSRGNLDLTAINPMIASAGMNVGNSQNNLVDQIKGAMLNMQIEAVPIKLDNREIASAQFRIVGQKQATDYNLNKRWSGR